MQCKQINNLTMKYFDGNISELELEQLLRHNQKCPDCAAEFEILKDAIFEIETLPDIEPPESLNISIMKALAEQKSIHFNVKQLICWLVGFVGLVLFTYNIIAYVIFPMMGVNPLVDLQNFQQFIYMLLEKAKDGLVTLSLYLGKLLVIRNILLREHTLLVFLWLGAFAAADLMLYRIISLKRKKDFADLN